MMVTTTTIITNVIIMELKSRQTTKGGVVIIIFNHLQHFFLVYSIWFVFISTGSVCPVYMVLTVGVSPVLALQDIIICSLLSFRSKWFVGENCCGTECCQFERQLGSYVPVISLSQQSLQVASLFHCMYDSTVRSVVLQQAYVSKISTVSLAFFCVVE